MGLLFIFVIFATFFSISYVPSPLYSANQNSYFLHGLANANTGQLLQDWMSNSVDPFPLFSYIVSFISVVFTENVFYFVYATLLGIYIFSILGIVSKIWGITKYSVEYIFFAIAITLLSSDILSQVSATYLGTDVRDLFQSGVAGQYLLGSVLQPSLFGVFLMLSVYLYMTSRSSLAIICLVIATNMHPTYLLTVIALTLTYMAFSFIDERKHIKSILLGIFSLFLLLPIVCYSYFTFSSAETELIANSHDILINQRIPHHAKITHWFSMGVLFKMSLVFIALWLVRRHRLIYLIILIPLTLSVTLTLIQFFSENTQLALLFPWRISVFLVPLSSAIIVGKCSNYIFSHHQKTFSHYKNHTRVIAAIVLVCLLSSGISGIDREVKKREQSKYNAVAAFVNTSKKTGDNYLIPTSLEGFRLRAATAVFIDSKTHPYKPAELIEWNRRLQLADEFYAELKFTVPCRKLRQLKADFSISHLVAATKLILPACDGSLKNVYQDKFYGVYTLD